MRFLKFLFGNIAKCEWVVKKFVSTLFAFCLFLLCSVSSGDSAVKKEKKGARITVTLSAVERSLVFFCVFIIEFNSAQCHTHSTDIAVKKLNIRKPT